MEHTLDPQDWEAMRKLAHTMLDDALDYLQTVRNRPVWQPTPEATKALLRQPLPQEPQSAEDIYNTFKNNVLPYTKGNIHPRFWSWVQGGGTPLTVLADMLAATMNPNTAIGDHAPMYMELQVLDWCKELVGFAPEASGMLLSGATMANLTALAVARNAKHPDNVRQSGITAPLVLYVSQETHNCMQKSAEMLGIGNRALRKIPVGTDFKMDTVQLEKQITQDRAQGLLPFCVVGNAGTVNTGAIDNLAAIAEICRREELWFHVDGAFGAWAKLLPDYAPQLKAIENADSIAFDLHKWGWLPYDIGCVLVRDRDAHRAAFATEANYLLTHERGLAAGPEPMGNYGIELSRGFRALKAWFLFKEQGVQQLAQMVQQNITQTFYLQQLIQKQPSLEMLTPVTLNIACFRYVVQGKDDVYLNKLNKEILMQLHEQGIAAPSYTILGGKYAIRVANVNHRSRREDFEALVEAVLQIGAKLVLSL